MSIGHKGLGDMVKSEIENQGFAASTAYRNPPYRDVTKQQDGIPISRAWLALSELVIAGFFCLSI